MDVFYTTYPISIFFIIIITGLVLLFSLTNIILWSSILFLAYMDCISITPLIRGLDQIVSVLFKDNLGRIKQNIRDSFLVKGNTEFKGKAIYIFHPHGVCSLAHAFHIVGNITDWPNKNIRAAVHTLMTSTPFIKDFHNNRVVRSNYEDMKGVLVDGKSLSVALGGLSETRYLDAKKITAIVRSRKGVFKMALETGTPIIPVITYGENMIYQKMDSRISDLFEYLFKIHVPIPTLASIKSWFQIYKEPLRDKIETHLGATIEVGEPQEPTDQEIVGLRDTYIEALRKLYRETRPADYEAEIQIL